MKNVLEWLEATVEKYPDKPAFSDTECSITFAQVYDIATWSGQNPCCSICRKENGDTGILSGSGICRQTVCAD